MSESPCANGSCDIDFLLTPVYSEIALNISQIPYSTITLGKHPT